MTTLTKSFHLEVLPYVIMEVVCEQMLSFTELCCSEAVEFNRIECLCNTDSFALWGCMRKISDTSAILSLQTNFGDIYGCPSYTSTKQTARSSLETEIFQPNQGLLTAYTFDANVNTPFCSRSEVCSAISCRYAKEAIVLLNRKEIFGLDEGLYINRIFAASKRIHDQIY
ncbi:unnamed protein product [Phytomonas sp. Hart1]|nr:unnamed protein product [Phytomonas sp. Hart1]|eukprot:CCW67017.1 unnamed protein product [Phytomonas sp. isolate Hart1]